MTTTDNILNWFNTDIQTDVLLIQPSTLFQQAFVDPDVFHYFNSLRRVGELSGDSPVEPNYGILTLATRLRESNIKVQILDFNYIDFILRQKGAMLSADLVESILKRCHARLYGISYMTSTFGNWEDILYTRIRSLGQNSETPIVYGGIHPSMFWQDILNKRNDKNLYIMLGEGDYEFATFCKTIIYGGESPFVLNGIAGYSTSPQKQVIPPHKLAIDSLPDYSLMPSYTDCEVRRFYITRGCNSGCSFCSVSSFHSRSAGQYYRQLYEEGADIVFPQIDQILKDWGNGKKIIMGDLTFFETEWYFKEFCRQLADKSEEMGLHPKWWCQTRADCINDGMIKDIKAAGCNQIAIGCETASNDLLKKMHKNLTVEEWKKSLQIIKENGISTQAYFIIGTGFESKASVEKTIRSVCDLIDEGVIDLVHLSTLVPFPGTLLSNNPKSAGINIVDHDFRNYWMNCDMYGYGLPVYETISSDGKVLLNRNEIYSYWKLAMQEISQAYDRKADGISSQPEFDFHMNMRRAI